MVDRKVGVGAVAGFFYGRVALRNTRFKNHAVLFGLGVGLGSSWQEFRALWGALTDEV